MKIGLISDTHYETMINRPDKLITDNDMFLQLDVLVLAGDIGVYYDGSLEEALKQYRDVFDGTQIVFVPGNHEFYASEYKQANELIANLCEENDIIFLQNDYIDIGEWTFFGATMWSNCESMAVSEGDFCISYDSPIDPINAFNIRSEHNWSKYYLDQCLNERDPRKTVVVTHFCPDIQFGNPWFPVNGLTYYFCATDLKSYLGLDYTRSHNECPAYWFFAHTHSSCEMDTGTTHVISNQRGYPNEKTNLNRSIKVIDL